jgi:hypothetical protein
MGYFFEKDGLYFPKIMKEVSLLIGKRIEYVRKCDIDHSGRGYYFPQKGRVQEVKGKNVRISDDWNTFDNIVEYRILEEK